MEISNHCYDELCDLIYQIPADKQGWFNFSKILLNVLNASYVHIQAIDFNYQVLSYSNGVGPLALETYAFGELHYLRYPTKDDPRWAKLLDTERIGWYQCHTHITEDFVQKSDLYQKILLPADLRFVATHELIWDEKLCVFLSISTSQQRQPLVQQELCFLNRLLPHLKRVVIAQRHLYEFSLDNIVGYNLIDKLSQPIVLLNLAGQVVHQNKMMQHYLKNSELVRIIDNKLILPEDDQIQFLEHLYQIEEAFRYKQEQLQKFNDLEFSILNTEHPHLTFKMNLLVSKKEMSFFGIRPLLMLSFDVGHKTSLKDKIEAKQKYNLSQAYLKQSYKLSKREWEVCELFVNGMKLEQIAKSCGLTLGSLRIYMKRIFAKTNTNSQTELMRLLLEIIIKLENTQ